MGTLYIIISVIFSGSQCPQKVITYVCSFFSLQSRTKSADDLRSPTPSEKESRIASTQSSNQLDHTGRRPPSRPSSISSSQLLDSQTPAKRAASNSTLDSGHGSCRSPRSPSAASTDSKGNKQRCPFTKLYRVK